MRLQGVVVAVALMLLSLAAVADSQTVARPIALYMADGQLISHPVRVYLEREITPDMHLCLNVISVHDGHFTVGDIPPVDSLATIPACEAMGMFSAKAVANAQQWNHPVGDATVPKVGTLLIFDLSTVEVEEYKAGRRVLPRVVWWEPDQAGVIKVQEAIGEREIYLASGSGALRWTIVIIVLLVTMICWIAGGKRRRGFRCIPYMLSTTDNCMSISMTQMACWTIAIGGVVLGFSLSTREIPEIPATLIFLMGLSATTTTVGYWQSQRVQGARTKKGDAGVLSRMAARKPGLRDLFIVLDENGEEEMSLAKAQMFFWTVLIIIMFVVKSILDGHLWEVPDGFVALMGISQAGYLGRKQLELPKEVDAKPVANETTPPATQKQE